MSKRTYHTRVPDNLIPFCEEMGELFGWIERCLYKDLMRGKKRTLLKKEYQIKSGINARQFNSIYGSVKGKIDSRKECHLRQIKQVTQRIIDLKKSLKKLEKRIDLTGRDKRIKKVGFSCPLSHKKISPRQSLLYAIHQKKRKLEKLKRQENQLKNKNPSLVFGGENCGKHNFSFQRMVTIVMNNGGKSGKKHGVVIF